MPEILSPLLDCYARSQRMARAAEFLLGITETLPGHLARARAGAAVSSTQGDDAAVDFLTEQLRQRPSVRGLMALIDLQPEHRRRRSARQPADPARPDPQAGRGPGHVPLHAAASARTRTTGSARAARAGARSSPSMASPASSPACTRTAGQSPRGLLRARRCASWSPPSLTRFAIAMRIAARLIDAPGARRSHAVPTPRGGGIGIVIAVLVVRLRDRLAIATASPAPASVDRCDRARRRRRLDRRPSRPLPRAGASLRIASPRRILLAAVALALARSPMRFRHRAIRVVDSSLLIGASRVVWSINLHNFMDGIDGFLAMQAIFVFAALAMAVLAAESATHAQRVADLVCAAATARLPAVQFSARAHFHGRCRQRRAGTADRRRRAVWQIAVGTVALGRARLIAVLGVRRRRDAARLLSRMLARPALVSVRIANICTNGWRAAGCRSCARVGAVPGMEPLDRRCRSLLALNRGRTPIRDASDHWARRPCRSISSAVAVWFAGERRWLLHRSARAQMPT